MRPLCNLHGVGYVQSSAKANSATEEPCLQVCVYPWVPWALTTESPDMSEVRLWRIAWHQHTGLAGLQTAASI
jgi:hypothetical protein